MVPDPCLAFQIVSILDPILDPTWIFSNIFNINFTLYFRLISVIRCILRRYISSSWGIFSRNLYFLNLAFCWESVLFLSFFHRIFVSSAFRIRSYPDPEWFFWIRIQILSKVSDPTVSGSTALLRLEQQWHLEVLSLILLSVTCWKFAVNSLRLHFTNGSVFYLWSSKRYQSCISWILSILVTEESKFADFIFELKNLVPNSSVPNNICILNSD